VTLLRFEPGKLRSSLAALDSQCRVAFAVACSLRAARGAKPSEPLAEAARSLAKGYAYNRSIDLPAAKSLLAKFDQSAELDRDDVASSYYALAAAVKEDLESAVWSAQRAYEATDAQAQEALEISDYTVEVEEHLLQCQEVQNELRYQAADLSALQAGANVIPMVIERSQSAA
jgi:hypothetical protein